MSLGWSDGGINGLLLAMRHPEKVKKLAITGANIWPDTTAVEPSLFQWIVSTNDSLAKVTQIPAVKAQKKLLNLMALHPHISTADLKKVKCPTLVIGGDNDVILPKHTMVIAQSIPQSYLWIYPTPGIRRSSFTRMYSIRWLGIFSKTPYRKPKACHSSNKRVLSSRRSVGAAGGITEKEQPSSRNALNLFAFN